MKSAFFLSLQFSFIAALFSQNTDTLTLPDAEIQSNRIALKVSETDRNVVVLDAAAIKALPVKSVAELLSYVAGLDVRQRGPWGAQSDLSIQGGTFEQALVLVDGVRMSDPQTGHHLMNIPVPLEMIERVEILKGPAASRYGLNAITGAVNIVTKRTDATFCNARLYAGSSFDTDTSTGETYYNSGVGFAAGTNVKNTSLILSGGHDAGNGYRYNTAFKNSKIYAHIRNRNKSGNEWILQGGYVNSAFGANAFYAAPGDKESEESVETAIGAISYKVVGQKWTLTPRFSYRYNYDHYVYIRQKPAVYENRHFSHVINPDIAFTYKTGFGKLAIGTEYRSDALRSNNLGNRKRENIAANAEVLFDPWGRFHLLTGVYVLHNSQYGWAVFPALEAGYLLKNNLRIFFNSGMAQRLPSYTDLYYKGPLNISNPNLSPENSFQMELGIKKTTANMQFTASAFRRDISNQIDWVRDSVSQPWNSVNYNTAQTFGTDVSLSYNYAFHYPILPYLRLRIGHVYLNQQFSTGEAKSISKNTLENLRHQLVFSANSTIFDVLQWQASVRHLVRNNMNAYNLMDLHLAYTKKAFSIFVDVNNILNTQYREISTVPMVARWFALGITANLK
jgi:vitamin B12 transporter